MIKKSLAMFLALWLFLFSFTAAAEQGADFGSAKGAVLLEAASGRVLAEQNCHERLPNASTTKLMTALITLEQPDLDTMFTVDSEAIKVEGSSMGLLEGDSVTLRDLAWGMMLSSGNDAANAAAVRIAGSVSAFCDLMNERAEKLGMKDTHFSSPSGLEAGEHYTTAYDMALLAREALKNESLAQMARSKSTKLYYGNPPYHRWLTNHNRLLWQNEDCIGLKTGFTKKAGRCLVSAAQRDGLTLIAVTLNCPDDFNIHKNVCDSAFESLKFISFEDMLGQLSVPVTGAAQQRVAVKPLWQPGAFLTDEESGHIKVSITMEPFVYAPIAEGSTVGEAEVMLGDTTLSITPLVTAQERPARFPERRSVIQRVKDFFDRPQDHRYPLNERDNRGRDAASRGE